MNYIFGYGSLICADSRSRTGVSSRANPIEVQGIARHWSLNSPTGDCTVVSAHLDANAVCNGVYFSVDELNLALFDEREAGYQRVIVDWKNVIPLSDQPLPKEGVLWAYVGLQTSQPSLDKPILQSYLDVIMNGCLDIHPHFAQRFTELTGQWQYLLNDRERPLYPRPLKSDERHPHIDQVLKSHLPNLWQQRFSRREH
ncbi:gamma-glutamylcyclotransferase family protein [Reinekea marinisedimentorum]|uniref:Gamma-glutamyl AIG2-like cyclotransferase n=1 Tax=Reinekea marinisedimentorum TaxID=230495 RepID=A0A4R3I645_9GAMM|nr:gamma-glutamylcyclotransferase family protein [Reinekea marinisedimentorum]TCS40763.1 hypothetical protein BCF53_108128 [Reinekea marinisedimentorum]